MAATRKAHVKLSVEPSAEEEEEEEEAAQHDTSAQRDEDDDDDDDEGSVQGEHDVENEDDDEEGDNNDADGGSDGGEADKEDEQGGDEDEEQVANPNAGWGDAMAKILQKKTVGSKPSILVKNKQLEKIKEKEKQERLEQRNKTDKKRVWEMMCRVKPDISTDREAERTFQRTATRGVVQLFNAVRKHQNLVNDKVKKVGGSERKKAKLLSSVSKKDFIDVLRGKDTARSKTPKAESRTAAADEDEKPSWSVLRDDFMMGAKMKDWDKQSDTEAEPGGTHNGGEEDSDSD